MSDDKPDDEDRADDDGSPEADTDARPARAPSQKRRKKAQRPLSKKRNAQRSAEPTRHDDEGDLGEPDDDPRRDDAHESDANDRDPESDDADSVAAAPPLDDEGRERPLFVVGFPRHPELDELVAAFEAGDYAEVRSRAPDLAARTDNAAVRDAALELRRRLDPDPLARYLLLAAVTLLVFLSLWAYSHAH